MVHTSGETNLGAAELVVRASLDSFVWNDGRGWLEGLVRACFKIAISGIVGIWDTARAEFPVVSGIFFNA